MISASILNSSLNSFDVWDFEFEFEFVRCMELSHARTAPVEGSIAVKTILILEDEPSLMSLLRGVLGRHGYDVLEAASPEGAIRQFKDRERQVDLLLADVGLPRISGVHVAVLLRSESPDLRVILTSGYPPHAWSARDADFLSRLGSESVVVLPKPFLPRALLNTISGLIEPPTAILRAKAS